MEADDSLQRQLTVEEEEEKKKQLTSIRIKKSCPCTNLLNLAAPSHSN